MPNFQPSSAVNFTGNVNNVSAIDIGVGTTTGTGSNLISNSDYTSSMTAVNGYNPNSANITEGITYASINSPSWTTNSYILKSGSTQNLYVKQESPVSGGDNAIGIDIYPCSINSTAVKIPVVAGETYCFSAYTQAHRAKTAVGIVFYNASDTGLSYPESSLVLGSSSSFTNTLSLYNRQFVIDTAPANSAYAIVYIRKYNTITGQTNSYMWFAAPQFEKVNAAVTNPGPYMPGPAITTGQLGYTGELNATNGAIPGVNLVTPQGSPVSNFSPGTPGIYMGPSVIKIYDSSGVLRVHLGNLSI
jgi:hypothetical protein